MKCDPTRALRADAVYLSPSGRRCRWVPLGGDQRQVTSHSFFEYIGKGPQRHGPRASWADGFNLTPANYQLLREVADAPAR